MSSLNYNITVFSDLSEYQRALVNYENVLHFNDDQLTIVTQIVLRDDLEDNTELST